MNCAAIFSALDVAANRPAQSVRALTISAANNPAAKIFPRVGAEPSTRSVVRVPSLPAAASHGRGISPYAPHLASDRLLSSVSPNSQISNFKFEIARSSEAISVSFHERSSASLCGIQRLCVILFLAAPFTASCNCQLQLHEIPRSVDYGALIWHLSPFRINTSKNSRTFCILLIRGQLNSPIINTSAKKRSKSPGINTSEKTGGGGSSCNWLQLGLRGPMTSLVTYQLTLLPAVAVRRGTDSSVPSVVNQRPRRSVFARLPRRSTAPCGPRSAVIQGMRSIVDASTIPHRTIWADYFGSLFKEARNA